MMEKLNYISEEELEQLICKVEQEELVAAPPDLMENILTVVGLNEEAVPEVISVKSRSSRKKEFYSYCFRVITSVAAAVVLVFLLPEMAEWMGQKVSVSQGYYDEYVMAEMIPDQAKVVGNVPDKATVVETMSTPSKEEVLNGTGIVERVVHNTRWFRKDNDR